MVAASLPALRPLLAKFYDKTLKYTYGAASRVGYGPSNSYAPGYGQDINKQYLRQKNTLDDDDLTKSGIALRSFREREAFSGKRDAARIHTTEVISGRKNADRKISHGDDLSGSGAGNDYDSDEIILQRSNSESQTNYQYSSGIAEGQVRPHGIVKTTTVQITRQ